MNAIEVKCSQILGDKKHAECENQDAKKARSAGLFHFQVRFYNQWLTTNRCVERSWPEVNSKK